MPTIYKVREQQAVIAAARGLLARLDAIGPVQLRNHSEVGEEREALRAALAALDRQGDGT